MKKNALKILFYEHNIIKQMVDFLFFLYSNPEKIKKINSTSFEKIIVFFKMYVDICHHGKEEKILFEKLKHKNLSKEDENLMNELIEEHKMGRKFVSKLNDCVATKDYEKIEEIFLAMTKLYNLHIEKENKKFFCPAFDYFSEDEKEKILQEFIDFDTNIIHEKYMKVINELKEIIK